MSAATSGVAGKIDAAKVTSEEDPGYRCAHPGYGRERWPNPHAPQAPTKPRRSRSPLFHMKQKRGWTPMSICSCNGRRKPTWSPPRRFQISGPGISLIHCSFWRSPRTRKSGSISAAAAAFPAWCWPARWRARQARWCIWSSATPRRRRSCARRCESPAPRVQFISLTSGIVWIVFRGPVDCVTARAVAPLHQLVGFAEPLVGKGAKALFLKGQDVEAELTEATKYWKLTPRLHPSLTGQGWIVELDRIERRT